MVRESKEKKDHWHWQNEDVEDCGEEVLQWIPEWSVSLQSDCSGVDIELTRILDQREREDRRKHDQDSQSLVQRAWVRNGPLCLHDEQANMVAFMQGLGCCDGPL